jgi:glucose-6-phosphate-specific signal transduction histidine kinase
MKLHDMQPSGHSDVTCKLLLLAIIELLLGCTLGTPIQEMKVLKEASIPDQSHLITDFLHTYIKFIKNVARPFNPEKGNNIHNRHKIL